ncbi:hypothetical protein COT42_03640 [Candidatus Saganbacteria bacterium CG08_land_8_20_14_0_20_45_16]|uniref:Uncharacterized protein n=1 Tax=Candidatus Saganbacteria bacterium CG08_land_8_20_14_0_20_45_16 TaxID=2014293 RepID=A0A2H0Y0Y7_UNCSA|nr:MAG: hypothetical protein COT42_03640 [Candidatus Saganbacteria bacterium CG08_land_8_20_14_0_20_45_16]
MLFKNFKKIAAILFFIWLASLGATTVCLANNHHVCCPTQTADWHNDTTTDFFEAKIFVDLSLSEQIGESELIFVPQFSLVQVSFDLPPPTAVLAKISHQIHAPPVV